LIAAFVATLALIVGAIQPQFWRWAVVFSAALILLMAVAFLTVLNRIESKLNDLGYVVSFYDLLHRLRYDVEDMFTEGSAANPSLQLLNLKILRTCSPKRILELGSGQTTKVLSCYAKSNPDAYILSLEQDEAWINILRPQISHDYRHAPLRPVQFTCAGSGLQIATEWFHDVSEVIQGEFEYILVDGPNQGSQSHVPYRRSGILQFIPKVLAKSFVIVFDDSERYGEIMSAQACEDILKASGIRYHRFDVRGVKTQIVLCSPDKLFLRSI
jgi:hypothetical protein